MLKSKNQRMILYLLDSDRFVPLSGMAKRFGVSERALRYHVHEMDDFLKTCGAALEHRPGKGIRIHLPQGCDAASLAHRIQSLTVRDLILDGDEKKSYIISRLMMLRSPITIQRLADEIYVGRNTIAALLNDVEEWFASFGIEMLRKTNYGLRLHYTHESWREALASLLSGSGKTVWFYEIADRKGVQKFIRSSQNGAAFLLSGPDASGAEEEIEILHGIIAKLEQKQGCRLGDLEYSAHVFQMKLCLQRARNGERFVLCNDCLDAITSLPSYPRAEMLVAQMNRRFGNCIAAEEAAYLALQIFSLERTLQQNLHNQRSLAIAEEMIGRVLGDAPMDEDHRRQLLQCLNISIHYAVKSCQSNKYVYNPMFRILVKEQRELFDRVEACCDLINQAFRVRLRSDEIALLASAFLVQQLRCDEPGNRSRIRALLVCYNGVGTSRMLSSRLSAAFPNLDVIGHSALHDLSRDPNLQRADLIISTVPLGKDAGIPAIVVSPVLDDNSIELISYFMNVKRMYEMNRHARKQVTVDLICSIIDQHTQKPYNREIVQGELKLLLDLWNGEQ